MSRLTASPFHKPSPYEFPRPMHPLSPPETSADSLGPAQTPRSMSIGNGLEAEHVESQVPAQETAAARFRRVSTLAYHNSSPRESRDRALQRSSRLIVVIPPLSFSQDHGQLGHTLSSGPRHRLSQGILMPLFPTVGCCMLTAPICV